MFVCQFYFYFYSTYDIIVWLNAYGRRTHLNTLILASRSPRRSELLRRLGLAFETDDPDVDESCSLPAGEAVRLLSRRKASASALAHPGCYVLAADTLVSFQEASLGKPKDQDDAVRMLQLLSGRTHQVYTGVTVIAPDGTAWTDADCTNVTFAGLTDDEIRSYVLSGEPMDKAGAYALQGRAGLWVEHLDGSDTSVIGLPLFLVRRLLLSAGYPLQSELDRNHN